MYYKKLFATFFVLSENGFLDRNQIYFLKTCYYATILTDKNI